ncbi:voltage-gated hydrogen channel 1 [Prunus avium]|uniref:Voltage-gated hydrogen channel 1 n=1 Tax=Prunus avium TaxID=42229 RepID=A0A6P5RNN0_PRUAV|nr:voltage-gated hydrogen channel 1 [Prunus avium]
MKIASSQIQIQQPGPPTTTTTTNSFSIESIEASIQSLTRSWHRRQQWHRFFWFDNNNSTQFQDLNLAPWRTHLANFLESTPIHAISISLLIVDLILTILELSSSLLTKCNNSPNKNKKTTPEIWYHWVGIAILALLSAKMVAQAVGLGMRTFLLRRPGYVIDSVVLMGALVLEAFFERKGGGLLVVVSLWRVVRVVESAFELSDEAIEAQIQSVVCQFEMLREENKRLVETISEQDKIIEKLQEDLDQYSTH